MTNIQVVKDSFAQHRRKILAGAGVIVVYSLLGVFLLPWVVEKIAVSVYRNLYNADLKVAKIVVNPYVLSVRVDGLEVAEPDGDVFARAEQVYANLQLSSIFRLALSFAEVRLDSPEVFIARDANGALNAEFLLPSEQTEDVENARDDSEPFGFLIDKLSVNDSALHWQDGVPAKPVDTTFGPVNVAMQNLSTLPGREGQQEVVITTETAGTFSWSGSLQLNPLSLTGRAGVKGSHVELVSAYVRDDIGFEFTRGDADIELNYSVEATDNGLQARIDNLEFILKDALIRTYGQLTESEETDDQDVLAIPQFSISGGTLRWPEQTVSVEFVSIADSVLSLHRDADGVLNILPDDVADNTATDSTVDAAIVGESAAVSEAEGEADASQSSPASDVWTATLGRFAIDRMKINLLDESVEPAADMGIDDLTLAITDIDSRSGAVFPTELSILTRTGGTVSVTGQIGILPDPVADLAIKADGLLLAETHPYLKRLADVNLDGGSLALEAKVSSSPADEFALSGDVEVTGFLLTETDGDSRLGSWDRLLFDNVLVSARRQAIEVAEVRLEKPYADVFIAEDGSINLGRVEPGVQSSVAEPESETTTEPQTGAVEPSAEDSFAVTVDRVTVVDAAADFADYSLPLPFDVKIAALNGGLTTIATTSEEPSRISLEGKVNDFGLLSVTGTLTPLDVTRNTNVELSFENVEIPRFSAYTVAFAGREIASGKLDLGLQYEVNDSALVGENKVILRDFTLGEKIDHPGAMSLPLGLAVALLKQPDGTIDIDLPIRGNLDDPEFRYGSVVGKALVNLIVKVVASPFALLGKLVGIEAGELDHIEFMAGRSDLTPPQQERVAKLAEALGLRPELELEVTGVADKEVDGRAIAAARLDAVIEERIARDAGDDASGEEYARYRRTAAERLYRDAEFADEMPLKELREQFTAEVTNADNGRAETRFDAVAYTEYLRRRLIESQVVDDADIAALAEQRARVTLEALVAADPALDSRLISTEVQYIDTKSDDGRIKMPVSLATQTQSKK